ncbi:mannose-6-phosphate isomerase, class I [Oceanispirochaeta sp. M1]|uniref:mannose-6-phosphate isomerase, class I n=2 Tax=Oceanispirochaeta TaxID=2035349 RepID=UPI0014950FE4|nr:mannose-6-phosphate isomerase, class I [Oceanispirochaeta sp. M1]
MENLIQDYPWGSKSYLQNLLNIKEDGPLAELWMGVHPRGMSKVDISGSTSLSLDEFIKEDAQDRLGKDVLRRFGNLPYLFKFLAAGEPLSIQAHPNKKQAEEGFDRENKKAVPLDAFNRNYKDDNHKPEIVCAITDYWAMKGFRRPDEIKKYFGGFCPEDLLSVLLPAGKGEEAALKHFFITLMNLEDSQKESLLGAALSWCGKQDDDACRWVLKLQDKYPGDISVLAPLYLNTLCLKPGEALYLPAGELHAYLQGFGMELMANSDNVLRGGLTAKFMDLEELEKTLLFESVPVKRIVPEKQDDGSEIYRTASKEFELVYIDCRSKSISIKRSYPVSILAVLEGNIRISEGEETLELKAGESCFLTAESPVRLIEGPGKAFIARVPE